MAETIMPSRRAYWSKYALDSSEEGESAFVPGVSAPGNRRPVKMKGRKIPEIKVSIPVKQPLIEHIPLSPGTATDLSDDTEKSVPCPKQKPTSVKTSTGVKATSEVNAKVMRGANTKAGCRGNQKSLSLKDLPIEEKKRIASLIKELARVGDEKEKAIDQLHVEREQFEKQVLQLVDQQEKILNEREVIQHQLFQCQDLLTRYQEKIEQKQQEVDNAITSSKGRDGHPGQRSRSRSPESSIPYTSHCHGNNADLRVSQDKLYTSYIDKEIAHQRSGVDGNGISSIGGQSGVSDGPFRELGHRVSKYPDRLPLALREPIMSSTQKSTDIKVFNSEEGSFHSLQPDPSPRSSRISNEVLLANEIKEKDTGKSRVGFKDKIEEGLGTLHSPNEPTSGVFGDKSYMNYYKKLSQTDRKRELLRQREKLLDEQRRLKAILRSQESQLKNRQNLLQKQKELQQDRLEFFEKNGKFPLGKECVVTESSSPTSVLTRSPKENVPPPPANVPTRPSQGEDDDGSLFNYGVQKLNFDLTDEEVKDTAAGRKTPPPAEQLNFHSMATSPIRMDSPSGRDQKSTPRRGVDVGTSISHIRISPRTPTHNESVEDLLIGQQENCPSPHTRTSALPNMGSPGMHQLQNNLPLQSNRGRSNQSPASKPVAGNKTLSVIEILNTMEKSPSWSGSVQSKRNSPGWSGVAHTDSNSPTHLHGTPQKQSVSYDFDEDEDEEESQILEDVFFLK